MLTLIDRQMMVGYFKSYFICLGTLLSLYVIVDLFPHLDDFSKGGEGGSREAFSQTLYHIGVYYGIQLAAIFDRLNEAIVLLAGMFTVGMMQRNNEQIPLLSSGISTQRIVRPVLLCAVFMLGLAVLNQEIIIPQIAHKLVLGRDDPGGVKHLQVRSSYETNGIHISGLRAFRQGQIVEGFTCTVPPEVVGNLIHLTSQEARYYPNETGLGGYWELTGCNRDVEPIPTILERLDQKRYRLNVLTADFESLTRTTTWFVWTSTWNLYLELQRPESDRLASMAVLLHVRMTRPVLGMILVLLGLSVILLDQNRNIIISSGLCLVLCGLFFAITHGCKMLGENEFLNPALAAWLPIVFFGPLAIVLFDAVHT